jgi:hypothetical protein
MSKYLHSAAQQEFDAEVRHVAQGMGTLVDTTAIRAGVTGDSYNFRRMGRGVAQQKASQADVSPADLTHLKTLCYLYNWYAEEYTDIFDEVEVNFDEKTELAKSLALMIRRRKDQIILDAIAAPTFGTTGVNADDPDIGFYYDVSATKNFDITCLHRLVQHYQELENEDKIHIAVRPAAVQALLQSAKVGSEDYNSIKPLVNGDLTNDYMGLIWHKIGNREEGGIAMSGTDGLAFTWTESSVGCAVGIDMRTEVNYIPQKTSWLTNCLYKGGAVVREAQFIGKVQYDPAIAPTA